MKHALLILVLILTTACAYAGRYDKPSKSEPRYRSPPPVTGAINGKSFSGSTYRYGNNSATGGQINGRSYNCRTFRYGNSSNTTCNWDK